MHEFSFGLGDAFGPQFVAHRLFEAIKLTLSADVKVFVAAVVPMPCEGILKEAVAGVHGLIEEDPMGPTFVSPVGIEKAAGKDRERVVGIDAREHIAPPTGCGFTTRRVFHFFEQSMSQWALAFEPQHGGAGSMMGKVGTVGPRVHEFLVEHGAEIS